MTSISIHKKHIAEHIQQINDAISVGIEERTVTIGLHTSACSISLIELYLHSIGKISAGAMIKHEWFKRSKEGQKIIPLANRKLKIDFPHKQKIFDLMYDIEENRNKLIYGRPSKSTTNIVLTSFQKLHRIIKDELIKIGEEIE